MRFAILILVLILLALVLSFDAGHAQATETASPSPTPSATVVPAASSATVTKALGCRKGAIHQWRRWNNLRRIAFALPVVPFLKFSAKRPLRSASESQWAAAGYNWKHDRRMYHRRYKALWRKMNRPRGKGMARWWPLAKWVGWPKCLHSWWLAIGTRESHGCRTVEDYAHSGHIGFFQLAREWYTGRWPIDGRGRHFNPSSAIQSMYWSLRIRLQVGPSPWAL